jgi:hypothetical protein
MDAMDTTGWNVNTISEMTREELIDALRKALNRDIAPELRVTFEERLRELEAEG